jgi:hypothetical protein
MEPTPVPQSSPLNSSISSVPASPSSAPAALEPVVSTGSSAAFITVLVFIIGLLIGGFGVWEYLNRLPLAVQGQSAITETVEVASSSLVDEMAEGPTTATFAATSTASTTSASNCSSLACFSKLIDTCSKNALLSIRIESDMSSITPLNIQVSFPMKYEIIEGGASRCVIKETYAASPVVTSYELKGDVETDNLIVKLEAGYEAMVGTSRVCYGTTSTFNQYILYSKHPTISNQPAFGLTCK